MQEQLKGAMANAMNAAGGGLLGGGAAPANMPGRRLLAAMVAARESACECKACGLLRREMDEVIGQFLRQAAEETGEPAAPAAVAPAPAAPAEVTSGAGNDPPA